MSESYRPGAFDDDSEDAAELEQLRREAAILREQLHNAGGSQPVGRDVQLLESRIDSLAARNAKLMDTLKDARQQLLALRHVYLGYWIAQSSKMDYKIRFGPFELLLDGRWQAIKNADAARAIAARTA